MSETMNENKENRLTLKQNISFQLYLFRLCYKSAKGHFLFHILDAVKVEVFIFIEHVWWIKYTLSAAEGKKPFQALLIAAIGILVLFIFHQLVDAIYNQWSSAKIKPVLYQSFRERIYKKAGQIDLECYDDPYYYNDFILSVSESDKCVDRFLENTYELCRALTVLIIYTGYLALNNWIGVIVVGISFLFTIHTERYHSNLLVKIRLAKNYFERKRAYVHRIFYLHNYAKELRLNKEYEKILYEDFESCNNKIQEINKEYGSKFWIATFLRDYISKDFLVYAVFVPVVIWDALIKQRIDISAMIVLIYAVRQLSASCNGLAQLYPKLQMNSTYVGRIMDFLNHKNHIESGLDKVPGKITEIKFSHVDFTYHGSNEKVLSDISLDIKIGQKVALVGYNGAGKSTLVKLLLRLYTPQSGRVMVNGKNIDEYILNQYRSSMGVVLQDFNIYAASLQENVVMDLCKNDDREKERLLNALSDVEFSPGRSSAADWLGKELKTEFSKDGVELSGGEAQRIAISRVFFANKSLIVMDEPSSALDPIIEYTLNQKLREKAENCIVIYISHRLSTTRDADKIIMLENGQIVEQGTHEELLEKNGKYAEMWMIQSARYREEM